MKYDIAVVGATGLVGDTMIRILAERKFPIRNLYPLASSRSIGKTVKFNNKTLAIQDLNQFDFSQCHIAFFSAGSTISEQLVPKAVEKGCLVIDNASFFRYKEGIPLVVREVNPEALKKSHRIIANPNCSTMQLMVALKPLYDAVGIDRINVATYQSVSGAGRRAVNALSHQTLEMLKMNHIEENHYAPFTRQIAFNVIPHIDSFEENGYTREEMKMVWETNKILADDAIKVNVTCVRVPVFYGHSLAVNLELKEKITAAKARNLMADQAGLEIVNGQEQYPTPINEASGKDAVFVGRIREDVSHPNGLNLWIVSDNLRKGAALNAVQLAELALENKYIEGI